MGSRRSSRAAAALAATAAFACGSSGTQRASDASGDAGSITLAPEGGSAIDATSADGHADATTAADGAAVDGRAGTNDGSPTDQGSSDSSSDAGAGCTGSLTTSWDAAPVLIAQSSLLNWPQLGVDRLGNAVVVWEQQSNQQVYAIWASSRSPGAAWTAPTALSNEDHPSAGIGPIADEIPPQLALSDDGTGVAIWPFHLGLLPMDLQASHYVPGQGWDAPVSIGATPADSGVGPPGLGGTGGVGNGPQATIDAKGNAIAVWAEGVQEVDAQAPDYDHQIYARAYTAGAAWGAAVRLSTNGAAIAGTSDTTAASQSPHVAVDPAGDAFVVWNVSGKTSGGAQAIEAVRYDGTAHTWGTPTFIDVCAHCSPAGTSYATTPRVAADAQGNSIVIWNRWTGDGTGIWFSRFTPAGGWSTPVDISDSKNAQNPASTPRIAMDPGGRAVATWLEGPILRANRYAAGAWGATPATLDQHSIDFIVQPAFDSTGNALLVWANSTDVKLVRFDAASSTFGTPTVIATAIQAGYAQVAARGGGACGGALAVFWAEPAEAGQGIFALGQQ